MLTDDVGRCFALDMKSRTERKINVFIRISRKNFVLADDKWTEIGEWIYRETDLFSFFASNVNMTKPIVRVHLLIS